jgi:phage anti-repressor protein
MKLVTTFLLCYCLFMYSTGFSQNMTTKFDTTINFTKDLKIVGKNKKYGLRNQKTKKLIVPIEYEYIFRPRPNSKLKYLEFFNFLGSNIYFNSSGKEITKETFFHTLYDTIQPTKGNNEANLNNEAVPQVGIIVENTKAPAQEKIFELVEIESTFNYKNQTSDIFLKQKLKEMKDSLNITESETIKMQIVIEKDGHTSTPLFLEPIKNIALKGYSKNIVLNMPLWTPAIQNGVRVRSYRKIILEW